MGVATNPNTMASIGIIDPRDYGARADGVTDCTAALNAAIAAAPPGSTIYFPPGNWRFNGNVTLTDGLTIAGAQRYLSASGLGGDSLASLGTVFLITGGQGVTSSTATPFLTVSGLSIAVESIAFFYPNQGTVEDATIVGYPYTIGAPYRTSGPPSASAVTIRNCCFRNSYQAIRLWSVWPFLIDHCHISPAVNGIWVDDAPDTCFVRDVWIEPVGFAKRTASDGPLGPTWVAWVNANLIAYRIGRVDSLLMTQCMSYPSKTGLLLERGARALDTDTNAARPWFVMSDCVFDGSDISVDVQAIANQGMRFVNCTFSPIGGLTHSLSIRIGSNAGAESGVLTVSNSLLDGGGTCVNVASARSRYTGCTFRGGDGSTPAMVVTGGDVAVVGCSFRNAQPQMAFAGGGKAIFADNTTGSNGVSVTGVTASNCV